MKDIFRAGASTISSARLGLGLGLELTLGLDLVLGLLFGLVMLGVWLG